MSSSEGCALALRALQSEHALHDYTLPLAPSEPPFIILARTSDGIGSVDAPRCPSASSLSVSCLQKRVKAGRSAAFVLAPPAEPFDSDVLAAVLSTVTSLVQACVELQIPADDASAVPAVRVLYAPAHRLPVTYEPSAIHGGVLVVASVPDSAPDGSRIVMSRASVAGCEVVFGDEAPQATVGFNHAPAPEGPIAESDYYSDVTVLLRLLDDGASTEESTPVRCF
jgi:hypothetical protein